MSDMENFVPIGQVDESEIPPDWEEPLQAPKIPPRKVTARRGRPPGSRTKPTAKATNIKVNLGGNSPAKPAATTAADADKEAVARLARTGAEMVVMALPLFGLQEDALDIYKAREKWAQAVGELAPYEKWLVNLAKGGEVSGRAMAWIGVGTATAGMVAPILLRHNALPKTVADLIENSLKMTGVEVVTDRE